MPLYRLNDITLDTRLRVGETVKVPLFDKDRKKVYLTYERAPQKDSPDQKPEGYSLPGGRVEREETVRKATNREVTNETGFVAEPTTILYVHPKRNHNLLAGEPHRLIIVLSEIVPSDGQEYSVPSGEYKPQANVVEKDEVDPLRSGWFPIDNLPIQIYEGDNLVQEGIYISHFLYLYEMYADGVINTRPFCADIMHLVADKIAALEERRQKRLTGDAAEAETAPEISEDTSDDTAGWSEEAIKSLGAPKPRDDSDDAWRKWAESTASA